ncbi:hypothetical protein ANN_01595 [Periplaneta americana]|uniref:Reverse transcriptase n=1 Tax=Periplaneta americana TaxID=6978 RepID=A0ABQ8TV44_PERAM|nr:hypothetical protein ANN_01595 [Periplaneta americana]
MIQELSDCSAHAGLSMNMEKTQVMTNSQPQPIQVNATRLQYVGQLVGFKSCMTRELKRRIASAWRAFWSLQFVLLDKKLTANQKTQIQICQRKMERKILGLSLRDKISNTRLKQMTNTRDMAYQGERLKWKWGGHVSRLQSCRWAHISTTWDPRIGRKHAVENGSTRRVDILAYNADTNQGIIVDPTIRFEVECHQSAEVHLEKKSIYEPTVNYFKLKYALIHVEVFGLLIGARGTIPAFFEEFRRQFALPTSLRDDMVIIKMLPHVLGFCYHGELLRINKHNTVRSLIASSIRQNASYEVYEEVGCVSSDGSTRRADIIIIDRQKDKGVILDPTIRFEMHEQQPQEVEAPCEADLNNFKEKIVPGPGIDLTIMRR